MKKDLITYSLLAIIAIIVAYFVCNLFLPPFSETSFKTLTSSPSYTLTAPNPEIFNFRAINPTVEGIVNCQEYDSGATCDDNLDPESNSESENMDFYVNPDELNSSPEGGTKNGSSD